MRRKLLTLVDGQSIEAVQKYAKASSKAAATTRGNELQWQGFQAFSLTFPRITLPPVRCRFSAYPTPPCPSADRVIRHHQHGEVLTILHLMAALSQRNASQGRSHGPANQKYQKDPSMTVAQAICGGGSRIHH